MEHEQHRSSIGIVIFYGNSAFLFDPRKPEEMTDASLFDPADQSSGDDFSD